jgi:hypothetical protein
MVSQNFTIHPIGQGLFYSGEIKLNDRSVFKMIFDCGSVSKGANKEPLLYRNTHFSGSDKDLDLLVISHFDADHVNQIKTVVENDIKIKKLVMPFVTFEERLFLALKHIAQPGSNVGTASFIIDPLGTLGSNLGEDGEVFIITSGDGPIPGGEVDNENREKIPEERFVFKFSNPKDLTEKEASNLGFGSLAKRLQKVADTDKGFAVSSVSTNVVEFLFYRKDIGANEIAFFEKVKELFFKDFKIDTSGSGDYINNQVVSKVRQIRSATKIKEIFKKAYKAIDAKKTRVSMASIVNPNTTALCMLHRNLKALYRLSDVGSEDLRYFHYHHGYCSLIQKTGFLRQEIDFHSYRFHHYDFLEHLKELTFPNVLLTSDSFLKDSKDVTALFEKYEYYKDAFWMFQVPHHGSKKNSDKTLFAQIPYIKFNFTNYGLNNRDNHPDDEVLLDLFTTGHYKNFIPANQFQGLSFGFSV